MTVEDILKRLGGDASVARHLNIPLTTVNSWKRWNFVPEWRQAGIIEMSVGLGKPMLSTDFPTAEQRLPRPATPSTDSDRAAA